MRFRNSQYTGENRCWPCTVVNLGLVGFISSCVAIIGSDLMAGSILLVGVASTGLRGYVIPGTPRLTRYLPASVLSVFNKGPSGSLAVTADSDSQETDLVEVSEGTIRLSSAIRNKYKTQAQNLASDSDRLEAAIVDAFDRVDHITVNRSLGGNENWFAKDSDGDILLRWEARPVAAMDVAGEMLLSEYDPDWTTLDSSHREQQRAMLRRAAKTCPMCGLEFQSVSGSDVVCCGGQSLAGSLRCSECAYDVVNKNDLPTTSEAERKIIE